MTPKTLRKLINKKYGWGGQTKLANEIGVTPYTVRRWLSGKRKITAPIIKLITIIFGKNDDGTR